ncbi:hypothetical protein [Conyzicola sp.]|uniref:hypothetical protein n=1 Tax=Conyzicola sp. TaxID=1969404 RepID=UPI00398A2F04
MRVRAVSALLVFAALAGLAGCATVTPTVTSEGAAEDRARRTVLDLVQSLTTTRPNIDDFARAINEQFSERLAITIVAVEEYPDAVHGDPFGRLTFLVPDQPIEGGFGGTAEVHGPFCFAVEFSYFGYEGDRQLGDGVDAVDCPPNPVPAVIPEDTTVRAVLAPNAADAARQVLAALGTGPVSSEALDAQQISAAIAALLVDPEGDYTTAAQPDVVVRDSAVGVAMGDGDDCVLVSWVAGTVADVYAPAVLLQSGELGCQAGTAIADPDSLRSPH